MNEKPRKPQRLTTSKNPNTARNNNTIQQKVTVNTVNTGEEQAEPKTPQRDWLTCGVWATAGQGHLRHFQRAGNHGSLRHFQSPRPVTNKTNKLNQSNNEPSKQSAAEQPNQQNGDEVQPQRSCPELLILER